jgi:hypothetical protein
MLRSRRTAVAGLRRCWKPWRARLTSSSVGCRLAEYWGELKLVESELNAGAGLEIWDHGELSATVSFDLDDGGLIRHIFIVRNPDKLEHLANTPDVVA